MLESDADAPACSATEAGARAFSAGWLALPLAGAGLDSGRGGVVVWLYPHPSPPPSLIPGTFEGRLAKDVITVDDLSGPLAGDWEGFLQALDDGELYVNVHTLGNPGGEVRDQVHRHGG